MTAPQMVLMMKLSTFAWNIYDGRQKPAVRTFPSLPHTPSSPTGIGRVAVKESCTDVPVLIRVPRIFVRDQPPLLALTQLHYLDPTSPAFSSVHTLILSTTWISSTKALFKNNRIAASLQAANVSPIERCSKVWRGWHTTLYWRLDMLGLLL